MLIYRKLCPQNQETCCEGSKVREYSYNINFAICQKTQAFFFIIWFLVQEKAKRKEEEGETKKEGMWQVRGTRGGENVHISTILSYYSF